MHPCLSVRICLCVYVTTDWAHFNTCFALLYCFELSHSFSFSSSHCLCFCVHPATTQTQAHILLQREGNCHEKMSDSWWGKEETFQNILTYTNTLFSAETDNKGCSCAERGWWLSANDALTLIQTEMPWKSCQNQNTAWFPQNATVGFLHICYKQHGKTTQLWCHY